MKSDIEIAQEAIVKPIADVAGCLGIDAEDLELYGKYKAKISEELFDKVKNNEDGVLILVTAINPTPAGEGKTTTSIGLGQSLCSLGKNAVVALREPSLGPCMGVKGGACGGGYSQVVPMEDINLHFTGDIHAITAANNLLSSMIDNHIHHGNALNIDPNQIVWKRVMDLNDRSLRNVVIGLGGKVNGYTREDSFLITVASEVMAVLCLASDINDLQKRLSKMIIAYTYDGLPVTAKQLNADGAMTVLLKDAIKPNIVQTLEHTPVLIHGGPFANIAHGCNSVRATKLALKLGDYVVTEAGFGADLGAEKFFDIKCRLAGLKPSIVVLVATIRALKHNAYIPKQYLGIENISALSEGFLNLRKHIENIQLFGVPVVVSLNLFDSDTQAELNFVKSECEKIGAHFAVSEVWSKGSKGGLALAESVLNCLDEKSSNFELLYDDDLPIDKKIEKIAMDIYGAKGVIFTPRAKKDLLMIDKLNLNSLPVCIAKTQYSLSANPKLLGRPSGFEVTVRELKISAGAGFIVALLGDIMTMPGLPKSPSAEKINIDKSGNVVGLF